MQIHGKLVDIHNRTISSAEVGIENGIISSIQPNTHRNKGFILPGFVDSYLHVESTMMPPTEFARIAVRHGSVATVSDSPLIVRDLIESNAAKTRFKFNFRAPSFPESEELICTTLSEAREKHSHGMPILVREGSIAKHFNTLLPLMREDPHMCMVCTDRLFPDALMLGHLNLLVKRGLNMGMELFDILTCVCQAPVEHYNLNVGLLREGDPADFIIVDDLASLRVLETYIDGECVFKTETLLPQIEVKSINTFHAPLKTPRSFAEGGLPETDMLKRVRVSCSEDIPAKIDFVDNFGLEKGAIGSSALPGSRVITAVGKSDEDLCNVINAIIKAKGGIAVSSSGKTDTLPLPIAGLMSTQEGEMVARRFSDLEEAAKSLGKGLKEPFATLARIVDQG